MRTVIGEDCWKEWRGQSQINKQQHQKKKKKKTPKTKNRFYAKKYESEKQQTF